MACDLDHIRMYKLLFACGLIIILVVYWGFLEIRVRTSIEELIRPLLPSVKIGW